ncbi:MAG TPA: condensation domain-containing protein, partial [Ktedonobacteraceae bacterium]|nr:condensation domain-containing protein [Ktedonobacteraceae bacterium]
MSHRSVSEQSATPVSSEKRATLLQTWKQRMAAGSPAAIPLTHVSHEGLLPLSFAQERIWFLQQFMPDSSGYHLPIALHISGQVSLPLLEQSFTELLKRHVPLRTRFVEHEGRPAQVIMPPPAFTIATCDLRTFPEDERDRQLQQHIQEEYARPFDLTSGPLLRAFFFELTDQSAVLLLLLHHLITDGWSNVLIIKELGQIYGALAAGQPISLPELSYQYPDLVHWQRQRWQEHALARQQTYWQELLGNAPFLLQLPLDHPRPAIQTSRGAIHRFLVAPHIQEELKRLSQQEGATFVMAVLALFTLLLWRLTRQDDILIGMPAFNRTRSEAENLVGLFVNTIVLRTTCSPQDTFRTLLRQVRQRMLGAYEHQEYPFEKLVEALQPERDTSQSPLFQVMLSVSAGDDTEQMSWPGATVQVREVDPVAANFDLTLEVVEQAGLASFAFV